MESYLILASFLLISARYGECLHCFHCQNISEGVDCNAVTECNNDESCYIERIDHANQKSFSLGCTQNCPDEQPFTIVGRSVESHCKKCCSVDGCNKQYCEPQQPAAPQTTLGNCTDNPAENCSKLSDLVNICNITQQAKDICRNYCGLCDMADGSWGHWHGWSQCSTTCGLGVETRKRYCNDPAPVHGGSDCQGNDTQRRSCFSRACPVHGEWSGWAQWESCSVSCGPGLRKRHRKCTNPAPSFFGHYCIGDAVEYSLCPATDCGNHSTPSTAAPTTAKCEDVLQDCNITNKTIGVCNNFEIAKKSCAKFCGLCGIGTAAPTTAQCDDVLHDCAFTNKTIGVCNNFETARKSCAKFCGLCGTGTTAPTTPHCGNILLDCDTANKTIGVCNNFEAARKSCAEFCGLCGIVDGKWADWSHWTTCSTSCGHGTTTRARTCSNPPPKAGGKTCTGNHIDIYNCTLGACPVHGGWGTWAHWSTCSSTCGQGITRRTRVCDHPRPQLLGNFCFGDSTEYGICLIKTCPGKVDGGWTEWSFWSSCSATCGNGHTIKQRSCTNPTPANGGLTCAGHRTEQKTCNTSHCPVNGGWGSWMSWSACSKSCGTGLSQRRRQCDNPRPSSLVLATLLRHGYVKLPLAQVSSQRLPYTLQLGIPQVAL